MARYVILPTEDNWGNNTQYSKEGKAISSVSGRNRDWGPLSDLNDDHLEFIKEAEAGCKHT